MHCQLLREGRHVLLLPYSEIVRQYDLKLIPRSEERGAA